LEREAAEQEHDRNQKFRNHFEKIAIGALWILAFGLLAIALIWLYHMVTPICWHWLDIEQLDDLQGILTGGLIVGVLTDHFRKRLS
jgi:hypothetical protein